MRIIFIFSLILVFRIGCYGTAQTPDLLIWENDTFPIHSEPFEHYPKINEIRSILFTKQCSATDCWRGYRAIWKLFKNELYLLKIESCCYGIPISAKSDPKSNLKLIFKDKYKDGMIKADWFSSKIWLEQGDLVHYEHMAYNSIYEREMKLSFTNQVKITNRTP